AVSDEALQLLVGGYAAVILVLAACRREILLVSYDRDMATALGRHATVWDVVLFALIGVTIALGVMTVGPLVIFAFLVIPPLAALRLVRGIAPVSFVASLIGAGSALVGFVVSYRNDLPLGPTDAVIVSTTFAASALIAWGRRVFR